MKPVHRVAWMGVGLAVVLAAAWWALNSDRGASVAPAGTLVPAVASDTPEPTLPDVRPGQTETRLLPSQVEPLPAADAAETADDAAARAVAPSDRRTVVLVGRIEDEAGRGIADAEVRFVADSTAYAFRSSREDDTEPVPATETDLSGRFRLEVEVPRSSDREGLPFFLRGGPRLVALHDDFATLVHDCGVLKEGETDVGILRMALGAIVRGRAVSEDGRPLSGVDVRVRQEEPGRVQVRMRSLLGGGIASAINAVTTAGDGTFEVRGLPAGQGSLTARRDDRKLAYLDELELDPAVPRDVGELVLEPGASIAGHVLDDRGQPVQDAEIRVTSLARIVINRSEKVPRSQTRHEFNLRALTDAEGFFEITGLAGGTYTVHTYADGFANFSRENVATGSRNLTLQLQRLGSILLTLTRATDGSPLDGATVVANPSGYRWMVLDDGGGELEVLTGEAAAREAGLDGDAAGLYLIRGAGPEGTRVQIEAEGFAALELEGPPAADGRVEALAAALQPEAVVAGRVVDSQGEPLVLARVTLTRASQEEESHRRMFRRAVHVGGEDPTSTPDTRRARSGADGTFVLTGVSEGEWELEARAKGYVRADPQVVSLQAGESLHDQVLVLEPGGSIVGTVTDQDGAPVAGAPVSITPEGPREQPTPDNIAMHLGRWFGAGGGPRRANTDGRGWYSVEGLEPGAYRVTLESDAIGMHIGPAVIAMLSGPGEDDGTEPEGVLAEVVAGGETVVHLVRPPAAQVHGQVMAGGQPVEGVSVKLAPPFSFGGGRTQSTDRTGRFEFDDVAPGDYELTALVPGAVVPERQAVKLGPGEDKRADLIFGGATVKGRVVDAESGDGVAGAILSAEPAGAGGEEEETLFQARIEVSAAGPGRGRRRGPPMAFEMEMGNAMVSQVRTDEKGRFEVRFLKPGSWILKTVGGGYIPGRSHTVEAVEGKTVDDVVVEVTRGAVLVGEVVSGETGDLLDDVPVRLERQSGGESFTTMVTTRRGGFRFEGLEAGEYELSALGSGFGSVPLASRAVQLEEGEELRVALTTGG